MQTAGKLLNLAILDGGCKMLTLINQMTPTHIQCLDILKFKLNSRSRSHFRSPRRLCICSASPFPPTTCLQAVSEARAALRRYREASKESKANLNANSTADPSSTEGNQKPLLSTTKNRLTVNIPVPSPSYTNDDLFRAFDEGEWPGGIQQRFRALRPLVEKFIDSFGSPSFIGMLESPADGIGAWTAFNGSATILTFVNNATFAPFVRLCQGDFCNKILDPDHLLLVINPNWTTSKDIGQLWDRDLKAKAAYLIDDPNLWLPLYHLEDLRTAAGSLGVLWKSSHSDPWRLYSAVVGSDLPQKESGEKEEERGNMAGRIGNILTGKNSDNDQDSALIAVELLLESEMKPERSEMIRLLNDAAKVRKEQEKNDEKKRKKDRGWWGGL